MRPHTVLPRRGRLFLIWLVSTLLVGTALSTVAVTAAHAAGDPCAAGGNKIACENSKPGTPQSVWDDFYGSGDDTIQGFATDISVNVGQRIDFKIDTDARAYSIDIYRTGYYGGDGARKVASIQPSVSLPQTQPNCITDVSTQLYDCGNWAVSASWNVPSDAVSGVYFAHLNRTDTGGSSHITFIVRDDSSHSDLVFQTSDTTWQAYNAYGGGNFYNGGGANGRAFKLSYNRPFSDRGRDFYFANEYPMVRFLEKNGYDVSYIAGVDTDRRGSLLTNHKTFLSVGHDEYWSGAQRANVEAARDAGVNMLFASGNEMYWHVRYENSADTSHTAYRTIVCYKETWNNAKIDPSNEWTGTWRDPRFASRANGAGLPENAVTGVAYMVNDDDLAVTVSAAEGKLRLWRNTSLASMAPGTTATLAQHTIGYESDEDLDNGFRPQGLIRLSTTTGSTPVYLRDFGNTTSAGTTTHHLTMYRAASGALVFSAGSIQWTWGLDETHDSAYAPTPADPRMQQAAVNLLADMSAQPTTLDPALTPATRSTDTTGPTTSITSPAAGSSQPNGTQVTVTGTASDVGGVVAGVEVSTDAGVTWHPATGTTSWSYTYVQHGMGTVPIRVRAVDDSANIGTAATRSFSVACPCSVFGPVVPDTPAANDSSAAELGTRFSPKVDGFVTGVRFYKGTGNGGTHTGSLWSAAGQRLATGTFTNEGATGWQTLTFASPVAVAAGQTYVASYTAPQGHYAVAVDAFYMAPTDADPLTVDGGFGATPAGVFGNAGSFPGNSYRNSNYYVDALFTSVDASPLVATQQWPLADSSSVPLNSTVKATYTKPLVVGSQGLVLKDAVGNTVAGTTAYDTATRTITFTPTQPLDGFVKYTATVSGTDAQGNGVTTGKTWQFTTARPPGTPGVCPCTLFDDTTTPSVLDSGERVPVTLGVRFQSTVPGTITGMRFYKGPGNTGTHVGTLWSAGGTALATGTFTGESSSGWQTLSFASPVSVSANTDYVVSYRAPTGAYSLTPNAFSASDLSRTPLRVVSSSGSYNYSDAFPGSGSTSNYMVDPIFQRLAPTISVAAQSPAPGAVDVARTATIRTWLSDPINTTGYSMTVRQGTTTIAGTTSLSADGTTLTFTPSAQLPADSDITATLSGVVSTAGATLPTQTWTFHTEPVGAPVSQTLFDQQLPATASVNESSPVEVGTVVTPQENGTITGVRFFKGTGNGGTHTGSLWSMAGTRLATVTFVGETPSGWQTATFSQPVAVTSGTSYIVSYLAPQGHYSATSGFFNSAYSNGDLFAPAGSNGRYLYGAAGGFPQFSWASTNYFVDVVFKAVAPTISVTNRTPAPGATGVFRGATPSITFSSAIGAGWSMTASQGTTTIPGTAALSADAKTLTFTPASDLPADADVTLSVSGVTSTRGAVLPTDSWTFHTDPATQPTVSMFSAQTPATASINDSSAVELGTAFSPSVNGSVLAIRFYKGTGNTGTHTGSLWSSTGTRLGTVTFTNETASGWQTATLATPVALTAGQTYVVSYLAPNGHYSGTPTFFSSAWTAGPLTAPSTNNGRYLYGGGFPTNSYNATNYFVDVVFRTS